MPRGPATLPYVLSTLKHDRPDEFRKHLRVTPLTFDRIVAEVVDDSVFSNNSQNVQIPVEHQLAIALYRFGHFRNGASIVSLLNLRIIDYGYGFTGSTHDSMAWNKTKMAVEHADLLEEHEWIWADSAYPLETWMISPFKKPE
ncbi:hypothetical protein BDW22DRAFT_1430852 [Trametopsis cervina]|nr:hypothetical protein BDW22DRAFT_1430852 [Trametopsis cervina]